MQLKIISLLLLAGITYAPVFAQPRIKQQRTIGGSNEDFFAYMALTKDGGLIAGGYSYSDSSFEKSENNHSKFGADMWIVKLDSFGRIQWDKTIGGDKGDNMQCIEQTSDGGYVLGGSSASPVSSEKTQRSRGNYDYWVVKLDNSGNIQWNKTIGGSDYDDLYSVQQTIDDGYILGGSTLSDSSGEKTENGRGNYDYWVVKLNSRGNVQWDKTIGGSYDDGGSFAPIVREINKNHYVLGGYSNSGISGDKTGKSRGLYSTDYWIVKINYVKPDSIAITGLQDTDGLKTATANNKSFIIYPNPAKDKITIQANGKFTFTLTNQQGKAIFTKTIENSGSLDVSNIPAGIYFLINTTTGVTQKLMVAR